MSCVHPVAILSAVFWIVCSFCVFVSDMMGDQTVLVYSSIGRVIVLYVLISVSLVLPQCVVVRAFSIFSVGFARFSVFCVCCAYVSLGSSVSPSILGCLSVGSVVLFILSVSVVLYCAGSGVKSVVVVLFAFSLSWLFVVHSCICSKYGWTCSCAVSGFVCVESMVMSCYGTLCVLTHIITTRHNLIGSSLSKYYYMY